MRLRQLHLCPQLAPGRHRRQSVEALQGSLDLAGFPGLQLGGKPDGEAAQGRGSSRRVHGAKRNLEGAAGNSLFAVVDHHGADVKLVLRIVKGPDAGHLDLALGAGRLRGGSGPAGINGLRTRGDFYRQRASHASPSTAAHTVTASSPQKKAPEEAAGAGCGTACWPAHSGQVATEMSSSFPQEGQTHWNMNRFRRHCTIAGRGPLD